MSSTTLDIKIPTQNKTAAQRLIDRLTTNDTATSFRSNVFNDENRNTNYNHIDLDCLDGEVQSDEIYTSRIFPNKKITFLHDFEATFKLLTIDIKTIQTVITTSFKAFVPYLSIILKETVRIILKTDLLCEKYFIKSQKYLHNLAISVRINVSNKLNSKPAVRLKPVRNKYSTLKTRKIKLLSNESKILDISINYVSDIKYSSSRENFSKSTRDVISVNQKHIDKYSMFTQVISILFTKLRYGEK